MHNDTKKGIVSLTSRQIRYDSTIFDDTLKDSLGHLCLQRRLRLVLKVINLQHLTIDITCSSSQIQHNNPIRLSLIKFTQLN